MLKKIIALNLKMFDGGAASGDGAGTGAAAPANSEGDLSNVVYGKQEQVQDPGNAKEPTPPVRNYDDEFANLIKGEYKDAYQKATQKMINSRFAKYKGMESRLAENDSLIAVLKSRYGEQDPVKLRERIENDTRLVADKAFELGVTEEQMLEIEKIRDRAEATEREKERYKHAYEEYLARENSDRQYFQWVDEANYLKNNVYADFNLDVECQNPQFVAMLRNGVNVKTAYEAMHHDELVAGYVQNAVKQSAKATAQNIAARGTRPKENGAGSGTPALLKSDVSKLTAKDRAEIAKRVMRGEQISF